MIDGPVDAADAERMGLGFVRPRVPTGALIVAASCVALVTSGAQSAPAAAHGHAECGRGYDYAGIAGWGAVRGVAATLTVTSRPRVHAGHVGAWVGVGGTGLGPRGTDAWIQVGLSAFLTGESHIYTEIALPYEAPVYRELARVRPGEHHRVAVVMESGDHWTVLLDGRRVSGPVQLPGSAHWRPVATTESWSPEQSTCNALGYRFDRVTTIPRGTTKWHPLTRVAVLRGHRQYAIRRAGASFIVTSRS